MTTQNLFELEKSVSIETEVEKHYDTLYCT